MKNKLKKTLPLLLLFLLPVTAYAAMHWKGTPHVTNIKDNLELIQVKMDELKSENGNSKETIRTIEILLEQEQALREQRERELADKQQEIQNKTDEINQKNQENNQLKQQLDQALRDVQEIERITQEMIE